MKVTFGVIAPNMSQSPYKGFNRRQVYALLEKIGIEKENVSQSPYKGFNSSIRG